MIRLPFLRHRAALLLAGALALPAHAADHPSVKRPFNLPPAADLHYQVKAKQSGMTLYGTALLQWRPAANLYRVNVEMHAMLAGKIFTASSDGIVDGYGLAPLAFVEKRFRKSPTSVTFNRSAGTLQLSTNSASMPLTGGEQDRTSITWQLIANARAAPKAFTTGSTWQYFVAGQRDAGTWTFKVGATEKIRTPLGKVTALRVARLLPPGSEDQQLDIWLAPALDWYPVKLRFTESDGNYIEQSIERIDKK